MPVELTGPEARGLMKRLIGKHVRPEDTKADTYGDSRRYSLEGEFLELTVENDWQYKDGLIRATFRDKLTGDFVQIPFSPTGIRAMEQERKKRLAHDRDRRLYWVRTKGMEACIMEVKELWKEAQTRKVDWYGK